MSRNVTPTRHADAPDVTGSVTREPSDVTPDWSDALAAAGDWTPDLVAERLADAMKVVMLTSGRVLPKQFGSAMPAFLVDLDKDLRGSAEAEDIRRAPSTARITMMEEAIRWPIVYLDALPGPRGMLKVWMIAKAHRKPWSRLLKARGIPLATAKRARAKALAAIAAGLNRDGVRVVL